MEMFYLTTHTTHFSLYGIEHMVKDHSEATEEICSHHLMDYSFRLAVKDFLCVPFHREDSTYNGLCYTSCGAFIMGNILMTYHTMGGYSTTELHITLIHYKGKHCNIAK